MAMSLRNKLFLFIIMASLTSILLALAFNFSVYLSSQNDEIRYMLLRRVNSLAMELHNDNLDDNIKELHMSVSTQNAIDSPDWVKIFVLDEKGEPVVSPNQKKTQLPNVPHAVIDKINANSLGEGVVKDPSTADLYAYSYLGKKPFLVLAKAPSSIIKRPLILYFLRTLLGVIVVICLLWIISRLVSGKITRRLYQLTKIFEKFGEGDVNARSEDKSGDEIGALSNQFNKMANKIVGLLQVQSTKVRMEQELKTAQRIQEYFLPDLRQENEVFSLAGYYEPASECGGDWWFYQKIEDQLIICISDVTGHGTPSAMVTSSCRSLFAYLVENKVWEPKEIVQAMNQSIYDTVRGDLLVTMIIARFDFANHRLTYCNASHEQPLYWIKSDEIKNKNDLGVLLDIHGPRVGEEPKTQYNQSEIEIKNGSRWYFYSDGIVDMENDKGRSWGERKMLTAIQKNSDLKFCSSFQDSFQGTIDQYRKGTHLKDDLSYLVLDVH